MHRIPFMWDIWEATRTGRWPSRRQLQKALRIHEPGRERTPEQRHPPALRAEGTGAFAAHPLVRLAPHGHTHQPMVGKYIEGMDPRSAKTFRFSPDSRTR